MFYSTVIYCKFTSQGSLPLKAIVVFVLSEILSPSLKVNVSSVYIYKVVVHILNLTLELGRPRKKYFHVFISCKFDSFYLLFFPLRNNHIYTYIL